jgi:hypothetical protein
MDYYRVTESLVELDQLDESASYEVDYTFVGIDKETGKFALVTASGCSCWDGDCDVEMFDNLDDMEKSLVRDDRTYNPSLSGAKSVMEEAKKTFREMCLKALDG